jgi:hypothetical protein
MVKAMSKAILAKEAGFTAARYIIFFSHVDRLFVTISNI